VRWVGTWRPKVNRHVRVYLNKTIGGVPSQKCRPAVVTALGAGNLITCRVRHIGETYVNIDLRTDPNENLVATKYVGE